jgi:hypothetical protein
VPVRTTAINPPSRSTRPAASAASQAATESACFSPVAVPQAALAAAIRRIAPLSSAARQRLQRAAGARALVQELLRPLLAQSDAQRADRRDRRVASFALGRDQHVGQCLPPEQRFLARFDRAEAGDEPRLDRKRCEQALAEAVDRQDTQAAAGRIEHLGE